MLIHLVYEEEYVEQLRQILEDAGHTVAEWDYSLTQFADFSEKKEVHAEIAIVDGQAGVMTKREIIESLGRVRRNLPHLRLIVIFSDDLQRDESLIAKLLTYSIYDMYFIDSDKGYSIDTLEYWISHPKTYSDYDVNTQIQGTLDHVEKPRIQEVPAAPKLSQPTQPKTMSLPKLPQLPHVEVKLPDFSSVVSKIHLPRKKPDEPDAELCWEDEDSPESTADPKALLGCVIWFWGSVPGLGVTYAAVQFANDIAESVPVLLLDGNLVHPSLASEYECLSPGWECSWQNRTPGIPPEKYYAKGNLNVWTIREPIEAAEAAEMWSVALFHIRTPRQVVVVDGGTLPPPEGVDFNVLMADGTPGELDEKTVCLSREDVQTMRLRDIICEKVKSR
ncbi:hypothetical protein CEB3_c05400 [Peptococcaceae bacterium CEB3]|nr:hypothetical protein CEB3_c05400 [Peptococcaceae bacterium CEB3]